MAFDKQYFYKSSAGFGRTHVNQYHTYKTDDDDIADVIASGYFNNAEPALVENDLIYAVAKDNRDLLYVVSVDPVVTADLQSGASAVIPDGSITHAKLADDSVHANNILQSTITSYQLAAGSVVTTTILDNSVIPQKLNTQVGYMARHGVATATATTSQDITVTGVAVGDAVFATMTAGFSQPIVGCVAGENKVTVHYAAAAAVTDTVSVAAFKEGRALT